MKRRGPLPLLRLPLVALLGLAAPAVHAAAVFESSPSVLRVGHWVEVRGQLASDGGFVATRVELEDPDKHEVLLGVATRGEGGCDGYVLLGKCVELSEKTEWEDMQSKALAGRRVKIEGHYRGGGRFAAREISPRGPGRERLGGRVDFIRKAATGVEVEVMDTVVVVPHGVAVEHERAISRIATAPTRRAIGPRVPDEDDLFGDGFALGQNARFDAQVEFRSTTEENFNLDRGDPEDRSDYAGAVRLRLQGNWAERFEAVGEVRSFYRRREDDEDGTLTAQDTRLGETFLYVRDALGAGVDLQLGRQDFDDAREWLYDQNLDGVRLIAAWRPVRLELSVSTSLSDASPRDRAATNYIVYLLRPKARRHLAAYAIHRDFDLELPEQTTHLGLRALTAARTGRQSWLELAYLQGELGGVDVRGWAVDLGATWRAARGTRPSFTLGYAFGSGDSDPGDGVDRTFRQSGLQDNNGKFGGVTSFRYYGELVDPELANLAIATLGFGIWPARRTSLDLVGHFYRQAEASRRLVDAELDDPPDGVHPELGWELDAVFGWRGLRQWDLEIVAAYFFAGAAFPDTDDARLAKVRLRYRF